MTKQIWSFWNMHTSQSSASLTYLAWCSFFKKSVKAQARIRYISLCIPAVHISSTLINMSTYPVPCDFLLGLLLLISYSSESRCIFWNSCYFSSCLLFVSFTSLIFPWILVDIINKCRSLIWTSHLSLNVI